MRKKSIALIMAGVLTLGSLAVAPGDVWAQEAPEVIEEATDAVPSLMSNDGEMLTGVVPMTEEERAEQEAVLNGTVTPASYLKNLESYIPENEELPITSEALGATEKCTGIPPITPAEGDVNTLVIISEFADCEYKPEFKKELKERIFANDPKWKTTAAGQADSVSSNAYYPKDSLRGYYQRSSYGKLNLTGEIHEFKSDHKREWYEQGNPEAGDNTVLYLDAVNSWVSEVLKGHDASDGKSDLEYLDEKLKKFDLDGDMRIDGCYFACAGGNTGWNTRWWSYRIGSDITIGSYRLPYIVQVVDSLSTIGEADKDDVDDYIETFIHETGHFLGLVDYYSYGNNGSEKKLQTYAMMDNNYTDQDGFAKMLLGWIPKKNVWIVTDKQVYNPKTSAWEDYTGSCTLSLKPYAETGDLALIIPKKGDSEGWNWVYDQFIMAEYYKSSENDTLRETVGTGETKASLSEGLRLFRVYGKLNGSDQFIAKNTDDEYIPLISDYNNPEDKYLGVYRSGEELTPNSTPASTFFYNPGDDGLLANTTYKDSGISITNITSPGETISFDTSIASTATSAGPAVTGVEVFKEDLYGYYVKVSFDRPVNYIGGKPVAIYDYDKATNNYYIDEKWGEITDVRTSPSGKQYMRETRDLYFMIKKEDFRFTDGSIVIPAASVMSDRKEVNNDVLSYSFDISSLLPEGAVTLETSQKEGLYDKEIETSITGAPEGAKIYYTLDGSEPTTSSTAYNGPFKITSSVTLKAIAMDSEDNPVSRRLLRTYTLEKIYFKGEGDPTQKAVTLDVNEKYHLVPIIWSSLDDNEVTFESSNNSVAMVDNKGVILARSEGTADITVYTANTKASPAKCTVTVKSGAASAVKEKLVEAYGTKSDAMMRQIADDLNGSVTMADFAGSYLNSVWIAAISDQTYSGKAIKPSVRVYEGVKVLEPANYTVSYTKNTAAGQATATVKFKGDYKRIAPSSVNFTINPAHLQNDLMVLDMGVKYNGRLQKPKPVVLWKSSGKKQALSTSNFSIFYSDASGEEVKGVNSTGTYTVNVSAKGKNFTGSAKATITVQEKDLVEKLSVKNTGKYTYNNGNPIKPTYGTDYTIKAPKGYTALTENPFSDNNTQLKVSYLNNREKGKMALILTGTGTYAGSKVVYLTIK